jgi:hypothetical protein
MDMDYFDYGKVAREAGLTDDQLRQLERVMRREFPRDQMMFELHVLRAVMAIREGAITLEGALASEPGGR